jgi:PEP-CTERM motif-containing protein
MKKIITALVLVLALAPLSMALADTIDPINLSFSKIEGNTQADQVNVNLKISQVDSDTLLLEFTNQSPLESVVSEIYFQDKDGVVNKVTLNNNENVGKVIFRDGAHPGNLPGGNPYNFSTAFAVEARNPSPKYGINPNETLKVYLDLNDSAAINSLLTGLAQEDFRVGMHVQSIGGDTSASYINTAPPGGGAVPEPGTMLLLGSALLGSWAVRRRRKKRA